MQPEWSLMIRHGMAILLFVLGLAACAAGMWLMLAREYQQTLKGISAQSNRLHARSLSEIGVGPVLDASARLIDAVNQLIRTAMGIGAFLSLLGAGMCVVAFWILSI